MKMLMSDLDIILWRALAAIVFERLAYAALAIGVVAIAIRIW